MHSEFVSLGELLRLERRPVEVAPESKYKEIGLYCFGRGIFHKTPRDGAEVGDKDLYLIKEGDFILQITFAWEGAVGLASKSEDGMFGSVRFPTFRIDESRCYPPYLLNYFKTKGGVEQLGKISPGSADRNRVLSLKRIPEVFVPLPPPEEQRRIVARIKELAAKIEEARRLREEARRETEALAAHMLSLTFGDTEYGVGGLLPSNCHASLGDLVTDVADGPHITPTYVEMGIPFVTVLNITSGRVNFTGAKYITLDDHLSFQKRAKVEKGDVLISKDGTIGVPCFVDIDKDFSFFVSVALIKPDRSKIDGQYLTWAIRSPYVQRQIRKRSRGDMIRHLVLREIRQLVIPVPPLKEQHRIVAYLDDLQAKVDSLKKLQAETAAELDALLPSILDKAFKGEL